MIRVAARRKARRLIEKHMQEAGELSTPKWEMLEAWARAQIQQSLQAVLEAEVTGLLGRMKSARRAPVDASAGYRNGYGKPRRLAFSNGTITVRRPRVRGLEERFESRVLPLFKRRTEEVGALLPELYVRWVTRGERCVDGQFVLSKRRVAV
jgi:transposase-like protein